MKKEKITELLKKSDAYIIIGKGEKGTFITVSGTLQEILEMLVAVIKKEERFLALVEMAIQLIKFDK